MYIVDQSSQGQAGVLGEPECFLNARGFRIDGADRLTLDAQGIRKDYLQAMAEFRETYRTECAKAQIDYVPTDTSVSFDKALMEYLLQRRKKF